MKPRRLAVILTRRWMLFAGLTAVLFTASALLLLFLLEDSFIDRRLKAAADSVADLGTAERMLPAGFRLYRDTEAPLDIHARLPWASAGEPFEMRRADGSYVHVMLDHTPSGQTFVLVYDVTSELTVSRRWGVGLLLACAVTGAVLLIAFVLARAFVTRVAQRASSVVAEMNTTRDPEQLRALAARQDVEEFQQLLLLHADAWEAELASVNREKQTLTQLAHELRTPLQSARTSLAILNDDRMDPGAWERLHRAVARLARASSAVLWLSTERGAALEATRDVVPEIQALVDEFAPLADARQQRIQVDVAQPTRWTIPQEIADAIFGNLLMNAVQHGGPGVISVQIQSGAVTIANPKGPSGGEGFGVGLGIVRRLVERASARLDVHIGVESVRARVSWTDASGT